jgi:hypothetical protein
MYFFSSIKSENIENGDADEKISPIYQTEIWTWAIPVFKEVADISASQSDLFYSLNQQDPGFSRGKDLTSCNTTG